MLEPKLEHYNHIIQDNVDDEVHYLEIKNQHKHYMFPLQCLCVFHKMKYIFI